ncbi:MAG: CBS domain-containing protein [Nanoarchaeota archaeon]
MKVSKVMNKAIVIEPAVKVKEAAGIMSKRGIGSLIVMRNEKIAGIVTERDVMKNLGQLNSAVSAIMSKGVVCIDEEESIDNAALLMSKNKIKRLPVLKDDKLVGIITATDVIANSDSLNEDFFID